MLQPLVTLSLDEGDRGFKNAIICSLGAIFVQIVQGVDI